MSDHQAEGQQARPPAAESGTPAPGEVGLRAEVDRLRQVELAYNELRASLLSSRPSTRGRVRETPDVLRQADDGSFYYGPASETPGAEAAVIEAAVEWVERIPHDSWPGAWADEKDIALILAVQSLTGDVRWPGLCEVSA